MALLDDVYGENSIPSTKEGHHIWKLGKALQIIKNTKLHYKVPVTWYLGYINWLYNRTLQMKP